MSLKTRITIVLMALGLLMAALALSDDVEACEPNWDGSPSSDSRAGLSPG